MTEQQHATDVRRPGLPGTTLRPDDALSDELAELAEAHGVATSYTDWQGRQQPVPARTVLAVLAALDIPLITDADVTAAVREARDAPWRRGLPDVVVMRHGTPARVHVHAEAPAELPAVPRVWVETEDGDRVELSRARTSTRPRTRQVGDRTVARFEFTAPGDLPLGWHTLRADVAGDPGRPLVVTPAALQLPEALGGRRAWGFMTQLYSLRSQRSWGLGDLADLAELAGWSARAHGAGFVLVNPLHAAEPVPPMEPSPYLPTTRRFVNPIYLRVEDIPEIGYLAPTERAIVEWHAESIRPLNTDPGALDRDAVWAAKQAALMSVFRQPRTAARQAEFEEFCIHQGQGLVDFATWCAFAERYGLPTSEWPAHVQDPHSQDVELLRIELAGRVEFHMWLQWCADQQLERLARVARDAGMPVGVIHDLAVGVHPDGSDAWALGDVLAREISAGAPPDAFNQQGQDWTQPPPRPDRLAALGYAPYRDMLRTVLRHAGAIRVDHIIGLFRLWWLPRGQPASTGTYVRYDHEALIGILALEAQRAGAFVIGEDLGNVEPSVRDYLRERGILGTSILWFEQDAEGRPLPPEDWRELCLATVATHDLPPAAGYLAGEHVELRERLGLLTRPMDEEAAADAEHRAAVLAQLRDLHLLEEGARERDAVEALTAFLALTPARLIGVSLADAVGDRRTMNQPGTRDEYPNWRLPLADGVGRPVLLEEIMTAQRVGELAAAARPGPAATAEQPEPPEPPEATPVVVPAAEG